MSRLSICLLSICALSSASRLRIPTPSDVHPFLSATPLFPTFNVPLIPLPVANNSRNDFGVGLPGGRTKATDGCSENRTLAVWDFGIITSPKYPEDYPPSTICEWYLESPENTKIEATVYDIETQAWFLGYFDSVSVSKDGNFYMVDNYAGDQNAKTPFTVESSGNKFGIRFKSDAVINYRGFKLHYVVKPLDEAAEDFQSADDGICGRSSLTEGTTEGTTETAPVTEATTEGVGETSTSESRIIGNNPAPANAYPWMVALLIDGKSFCGGTVIDDLHILTAAHCTNGATQITALLGTQDLKAKDTGLIANITQDNIFTHPKYNEDNVFNDIAILRLPEKLQFSQNIRPICLPNRKFLAQTFENVPALSVSGWGITADMGKISHDLQVTNVTVLSNANCRQVFRDILTGNQMCVKTTPTNSPCRGDSGGPLFFLEKETYFMQVGIVSFGTFTCERGFPVAFTRVTAFLDFVTSVTGKRL